MTAVLTFLWKHDSRIQAGYPFRAAGACAGEVCAGEVCAGQVCVKEICLRGGDEGL